jgi:hypothetical protein
VFGRLVAKPGVRPIRLESRPGARFWHCCQPVFPDRSPKPRPAVLGRAFGPDLSAVRVHTDDQAHRLNQAVGAPSAVEELARQRDGRQRA